MKIVEVAGTPRDIGRATGEALREEIREDLELVGDRWSGPGAERRLALFAETLRRHIPDVLDELEGTAEGADLPFETLARHNCPNFPSELDETEGCTNIAFAGGPDGPVWGKNNDRPSFQRQRPHCCRIVRPDGGIPVAVFTFCGMLAVADGMNAEGLALGHSSVGSVFRQSDRHVPIRLWAYHCLSRARSTAEMIEAMASTPLRGKGYTMVCVDRQGTARAFEAPCPLFQVRAPHHEAGHVYCVNCYQLDGLENADRRPPEGKGISLARAAVFDKALAAMERSDVEAMKRLLRRHRDPEGPPVCVHEDRDVSHTEYSMIGLPATGRVLYREGPPCGGEFETLSL